MSESLHAAGRLANRSGRNAAKRRNASTITEISRQTSWQRFAPAVAVAVAGVGAQLGSQTAYATNFWAGALNNDTSWHSTALSPTLTVTNGALYQVGDVVDFYGTTSSTNAFHSSGSSPINEYIVSVAGNTIEVSTTPGGTPINAVNTTTASTTYQYDDWLTSANWTGSGVANAVNATATFNNGIALNMPGVAIGNGGNVSIGTLNMSTGSGTPFLISGGNGKNLNNLVFTTGFSGLPVVFQGTSTTRTLNFGSTGGFALAIAGTQGLIIVGQQGTGSVTGTGLGATSSNSPERVNFETMNFTNFTGSAGIIVQQGELGLNLSTSIGTGTAEDQNLTVGNATTLTNGLLAGVSLGLSQTVEELNGNNLGRVWTQSTASSSQTLTVGGNNATGGNYGGIIGADFTSTTGIASSSINLATTGNGTQTISGTIVDTGSVTVNGSGGSLVLSGANTYTGATTAIAGSLIAGNNSSGTSGAFGPSTAVVTLGAASSSLNAAVLTGGAFNVSNPITVAAGDTGILSVGGNSNSNSSFSGAITLNSNLTISQVATSGGHSLNISGGITGGTSGPETVTFAGPGSIGVNTNPIADGSGGNTVAVAVNGGIQPIAFNTNNNYSGGTTFEGGTLYLGTAGAIGTTGTLSFTGGVMQYSPNNQTDYSNRFSTAPNQQYDIDTNSQTVTFATALTSSGGSLTKLGLGTLTLAASNTYNGATIVEAGTLVAGAANSLAPLSAVNISGGTLDASGFNNSIASLSITSGTLKLGASTLLTDTGSASFAGALNLVGTPASLPDILMTYSGAPTGTFATNNLPGGETLAYLTGALEVVSVGPASLTWVNATSNGLWDIATSANWNSSGSTVTYSDTSNPSLSAGDNVTFNDNNGGAGNYNVSIAATVHPTSTTVTTNNAYTFNGSGGIAGPGSLTLSGSGSLTLAESNSYTGGTNVSGGTLFLAKANALPSGEALIIASGAKVVAENLGTAYASTVSSLNMSGGTIDLVNNDLVVQKSNNATVTGNLSAVTALLTTGFNGGAWNGPTGILSTAAATDTTHLTALGVIVNDSNGVAGGGSPLYGSGGTIAPTFGGATPALDDVLVKYTYYGDANLDGKVDGSDYSIIDSTYLSEVTNSTSIGGWQNGDFNYDGVVDGSDYTLIDNAFNSQGAAITAEIATPTAQIAGSGATSAVPEPTTLGLLGIGVLGLLGRRRRNSTRLAGAL